VKAEKKSFLTLFVTKPSKNMHTDTYCYAGFCVSRCAPFYTKTFSAIRAGELGVRF
jgi:hypothetical protein